MHQNAEVKAPCTEAHRSERSASSTERKLGQEHFGTTATNSTVYFRLILVCAGTVEMLPLDASLFVAAIIIPCLLSSAVHCILALSSDREHNGSALESPPLASA